MAEHDDDILGLANHTPKEIFNDILIRYAKITIPMHNKNKKKFKKPMDQTKPLAVYIKNGKNVKLNYRCQDTIFDETIMNTGLAFVIKTGLKRNKTHGIGGKHTLMMHSKNSRVK